MSQLSEKELTLMTAIFKHSDVSILASVDWNQVALDAKYKDGRNARIMGGRLVKKLSEATAAAAPAADDGDNNNDDAGEGSSKAGARAVGKKRKAAGTTDDDDGLPAKGARATKKPKATKANTKAVAKASEPKVKVEDQVSDAETEQLVEAEEAGDKSNA